MKKIKNLTQHYYEEFERIGRLKDYKKIPPEFWVAVLNKLKKELFDDLAGYFKLIHFERKQNFKKMRKQIKQTKNKKELSFMLSSDLLLEEKAVEESLLTEYIKKLDNFIAGFQKIQATQNGVETPTELQTGQDGAETPIELQAPPKCRNKAYYQN